MGSSSAKGSTAFRLLLAVVLASPVASAAEQTATISLSATVPTACETNADSTGGTLDFGTLAFGEYASLNSVIALASSEGAGSIGITCVSGLTYTILLDGGRSGNTSDRRMLGRDMGGEVSYNLYTNSAHDAIWDDVEGVSAVATGSEQWHTLYALVPVQATPAADLYTDTVNVTINW